MGAMEEKCISYVLGGGRGVGNRWVRKEQLMGKRRDPQSRVSVGVVIPVKVHEVKGFKMSKDIVNGIHSWLQYFGQWTVYPSIYVCMWLGGRDS